MQLEGIKQAYKRMNISKEDIIGKNKIIKTIEIH